eukprot:FR740923.1.p1 GENE.FR740923.1~~FR740923.1.p1  ORF type:complete len:288 (+),score=32.39 FR740923.1:111-866(+)
MSGSAVDDEGDDEVELELQEQTAAQFETYSVVFPHESKLGMLLERADEWQGPASGRQERTVVKMIIENGAADSRGVRLGSKLVAVNEVDVSNKPYLEALELVKTMPRPLTLKFENSGFVKDASQDYCLIRKAQGYYAPQQYKQWSRKYFVIGGAVAKGNVLQLYESKIDYEQVVVNMFQNRPIQDIEFKAYKLGLSFKCGPCREKSYGDKVITYFWIKNPASKTKVLKLGSENASIITALHGQVRKYSSSS